MKKTLLYLLIFSVLLNVFTYSYFSKKEKYEMQKNQKNQQKIIEKQHYIDSLEQKIFDLSHYTLDGNYGAQDYIEHFSIGDRIGKIRDSILNNLQTANQLVGYDFPEDPMFISRLVFLNHRWILADFDNSKLAGQLLIGYYLNENGTFTLKTVDRAMYLPKPNYNVD